MQNEYSLKREGDVNLSPHRSEWMNQLNAKSYEKPHLDLLR